MMQIHPLAQVDSMADVDATAVVSAFCVVEFGVRIGPGTVLGPHCHILAGSVIGSGCEIHTGAVIGNTPQDRAFTGQASGVEIGDGTVIREHVTIHRGTAPGSITRVGMRCLLMAGSHVGHNCVVEDDVTLVNGALLGGYVHVGAQAVPSGHVAVHQFVRIGEGAMIGIASRITQDVLPFFMISGAGFNVGINRIGLRRMGASHSEIDEARRAFHVICHERHSLPVVKKLLEAELVTRIGLAIILFLASNSRRGFHLHGTDYLRISDTSHLSTTSPDNEEKNVDL